MKRVRKVADRCRAPRLAARAAGFVLVAFVALAAPGGTAEAGPPGTPRPERGRDGGALEVLEEAVRQRPDDGAAHTRLGAAYLGLGRYEEAADELEEAVRLEPGDVEALMGLGEAYRGLGRWQEAVEAYGEAVRLKPGDADAHLGLGITYGNIESWREAVASLKEAVRLRPDYAPAHYQLGRAYFFLGDHQGVLDEHKILNELDPELADDLLGMFAKYKGLE